MSDPVGVVLAAGAGTRMGELGRTVPKALLPVGARPVIRRHLDLLGRLGIERTFVVVGHRGSEIVDVLGDEADGVELTYVRQDEPLGSAHALACLRTRIEGPFVVVLGDYCFSAPRAEKLVERLLEDGASAVAAKREPEQRLLEQAFEVRVEETGRITGVTEKPVRPSTDLKGCGLYAFQPEFMETVTRTPRTALRDEYELTSSLDLFVQSGAEVYAEEVVEWDANLTRPDDVLRCNLEWLRREGRRSVVADGADVDGDVELDRVAVGRDARVRGPARLEEVVVLPGTRLEAGAGPIRRAVAYPGGLYSCVDESIV